MNSQPPSHSSSLQFSQLTDFVPRPSSAREPLPVSLHTGRLLRRALLLVAAGCALSTLALWVLDGSVPGATASAWIVGLLGLAALLSARAAERWLQMLFSLWAVGSVLSVGGAALATGWGLYTPGLLLCPLLVLGVGAALGPRHGSLLAALALVCLLVLALLLPAPPTAGPGALPGLQAWPSYGHALLLHIAATVLAWLGGGLLHRSLQREVQVARQREARFRGLLALAADAYWEIDAEYRICTAVGHGRDGRALGPEGGLGKLPWRLPRFVCDPETLDELLAELDARASFRELPIGWLDTDGHERRFLISGEPRFGERGEFVGYWGVARDITADTEARAALLATEARYENLFARIPTPLVLHRGGRIVDANPAALRLFEARDLAALRGAELLNWYAPGESREKARRQFDELEELPAGQALPPAEFSLRLQGRTLWVRAAGVRVATGAGSVTLTIYHDETERRQAEESVRRSEALLSHLVATSPDLITLTELASGRYVMVNHAFERLSGHVAAQAVGHSAQQLGLWRDEAQRLRFEAALLGKASISDWPAELVHRDGRVHSVLLSAARFKMNRREYAVVNGRDITEGERLRLEREAILNHASVGIAVTRKDSFVLANPHFERLFGWPAGQLPGQACSVVWQDEQEQAETLQGLEHTLQQGRAIEFEKHLRRRDGSLFLARVHGRAVDAARPHEGGTVWIVEDVTERRAFEATVARARDEAEAANRAKSSFLANTSHELRTPLNAMVGLARLARDPALEPERRQQYLDQICDSSQALAAIVSDILDLSKIEAGQLSLQAAPFDFGALLRELQRSYATLAQPRGLRLELQAGPDVQGLVMGDALRVRQILGNYLSNAVKFTARGNVTMRALRLPAQGTGEPGERVRLEVHDTGEGVPLEAQQRLFQPFTQADDSTTRRYGGTGLGLSICRELATLMGGQVGLSSQPGQGSCFWAELPLPAAPASATQQAQVVPGPGPGPAGAPAARASALAGRRVLIVEDNAVNMMIGVAMMQSWGLLVGQAVDGLEAVRAVQQAFDAGEPYDAVLMDLQMPQMSGHEATRALRGTQAGCHLPIIALTAAALVSERQQALQSGMNDFLTKPVDADRLQATLARWMLPVVS